MVTPGIHRIIEHHAATRGLDPALIGRDEALTYRELNQRANALARQLVDSGLRRGSRAVVKMERSPQLAVVLLAVLKAGGAYTWLEREHDDSSYARWPDGASVVVDETGRPGTFVTLEPDDLRVAWAKAGPNLPIVTRASDIAYVLPAGGGGEPAVLVTHATITALQSHPVPALARWSVHPAALDLWLPLMAGVTVAVAGATGAAA